MFNLMLAGQCVRVCHHVMMELSIQWFIVVKDNQEKSHHASLNIVQVFFERSYSGLISIVRVLSISEGPSQLATTEAPSEIESNKKMTTTSKLPSRVCALSDENILASLGRKKECTFPFMYRGVLHNQCIALDSRRPWCSTKIDANHFFPRDEWGYCVPCWT